MNVDSTIEDLEAQAYFVSKLNNPNDARSLYIEVELHEEAHPAKKLHFALVGLDFVAGFERTLEGKAGDWLLIPNQAISSVFIADGSIEQAKVELSASNFLDAHLRTSKVSVRHTRANQTLKGTLSGVFGNQLSLSGQQNSLVPLESIDWIAVDSLGMNI